MPTTWLPGAPRLFRVAIEARLRSTKARTALATPTPPTRSAVRPTSVRNWVKRSMLRAKRGSALRRERTSQPASGRAWRASLITRSTAASSPCGSITR